MVQIVEEIARHIFIPFTVGGGIRTVEDFSTLLRAGADKVSDQLVGVEKSAADLCGCRKIRQPVRGLRY